MTPDKQQAIHRFRTSKDNLLIVGQAGTGKSYLLKRLTEGIPPNKYAVVAPTGMAALNCEGSTIHGMFHLPVGRFPRGIITRDGEWWKHLRRDGEFEGLETLFIDEISMVRSDVLDALDHVLRTQGPNPDAPFGGVRLVALGDPLQLPPVEKEEDKPWFDGSKRNTWSSPWFFGARAWSDAGFKPIELTTNHRQQSDPEYAQLLDWARLGDLIESHHELLDWLKRPLPNQHRALRVMCTNKQVADYNSLKLHELPGEALRFVASEQRWVGETPVEREVFLKVGARVLLRANLSVAENWVNGTLAEVVEIDESNERVVIQNQSGEKKVVTRHTWTYELSRRRANMVPDEATYTQIPLTLAWAITIHKMQGQTATSPIVLEAEKAFVGGQAYVGLSRVCSRSQICIPNTLKRIWPEKRALNYLKKTLPHRYW